MPKVQEIGTPEPFAEYGNQRRSAFRDQFTSDPNNDLLRLEGQQFEIGNDLNRLDTISANEGFGLDSRLRGQIDNIRQASDRVGEQSAVDKASARSARNADNDRAQFGRATQGLDLSDRQKKSANRRLGLRRSLNRAAGAGATRRGFVGRARQANAAGAGFSDALFGQRIAGETAIASSYAKEEGLSIAGEAQDKKDKVGAAGQVVGLIASIWSSEELKHDYGHQANLLDKLKKVRINKWKYKGDAETHVGPFSEEFNREFGLDTKRPDKISIIDYLGVTLGAVKELDEKISHAS